MKANYWCKSCALDIKIELSGKLSDEVPLPVPCAICGHPLKYLGHSSLPSISRARFESYSCPISGKAITSEAAHRQNLAAHGCRLLERGELQDNRRQRKLAQEAESADFAKEVRRSIDSLSPEKLELLAQSDATVNVVRA